MTAKARPKFGTVDRQGNFPGFQTSTKAEEKYRYVVEIMVFLSFFVPWFLGFLVPWFLSFLVSKFLGFLFFLVSKFQSFQFSMITYYKNSTSYSLEGIDSTSKIFKNL